MKTGDLLNQLRMQLHVMGLPALVDSVLVGYLDNANKAFVNAIGGVPDEEIIEAEASVSEVVIPSYVLKIKSARLDDGSEVKVINRADTQNKYFDAKFDEVGDIKYLLVGSRKGYGALAYMPAAATNITLDVDRLPRTALKSLSAEIKDVGDVWQLSLVDHAASMVAAMSPDPTIRKRAPELEAAFYGAAREAKSEKERSKSKQTRFVRYGGL